MYNTNKANWVEFISKFNQSKAEYNLGKDEIGKIGTTGELEMAVNNYTKSVVEACTASMPLKRPGAEHRVPWWSENLAKLKKDVATKKRRIRCAAQVRRSRVVEDYLKLKEEYETEAAKAIVDSWKNFCAKQDKESVWEGIYRVIARTRRREEDLPLEKDGQTLDSKGSVALLAETLFPEDRTEEDSAHHREIRSMAESVNVEDQGEPCDPPFTLAELRLACGTFNPKKAPGKDGLTADICCRAIGVDPNAFLALINKCLELRYFPREWKEATVVVLKKPGKENYSMPKAYRPIGLLPVLGKICEKMLMSRVKHHILPGMSTRQYGFMPQRGTEDSLYTLIQHIRNQLLQKKIVVLVSLDIEGAFDSAWWPAIRTRLAEERCPLNIRQVVDSYLAERTVSVRYAGEEYTKIMNKGCVQGSIGGPILWNLLLDPLLKSLDVSGEYVQAFADDVVLVFTADTAQQIEVRANAVLERVREWGVGNKLRFAPQKTKAMLITRKLKYDTPRLNMGGVAVSMDRELKLLGVTIDDKLTFKPHVANVCRKALGIYKQLTRAAKTTWGLHPEVIRTIYTATVEPIILYGASTWESAVHRAGTIKQLNTVQRGIAQQICKAYRTVSLNSALALAGILPLDLRVREVASLHRAKRGEPQPMLRGREVELMASALQAPHPSGRREVEVVGLVNQEQLDASGEHEIRMFTDGSKIGGEVGAAVSIWRGTTETKTLKLKLADYCTVYQAELLALCRATKEALKSRATSCGIYSDSMAALQSVQNPSCFHPLAVETRGNLTSLSDQNKVVSLFWVKAHVGLEGNERADVLAKEAASNSKRKPDYDKCPVSFVKRSLRTASIDEWNQRYIAGNTAGITKLFLPNVLAAYSATRRIQIDNLTAQIMTGHGGFSSYLYRFRCKENPSCNCDPAVDETVPHILFGCPIFGIQRFNLQQEIGCDVSLENINELMKIEIRGKFLNYCKEIAKIVIGRNKTKL